MNENKGRRTFIINEDINVIIIKVGNDFRNGFTDINWGCSIISGNATIKSAFAGAGNPLKSYC